MTDFPDLQLFADIVVQVDAPGLNQPLTYRIPDGIDLELGDCVQVPLRTSTALGHVTKVHRDYAGDLSKIKDVAGRIDGAAAFDLELLQVAEHVAAYTVSPIRDAIKLIAPEVMTSQISSSLALAADWSTKLSSTTRSEIQKQVVAFIEAHAGSTSLRELAGKFKPVSIIGAVSELKKKQIIAESFSIIKPKARDRKVRLLSLCVDLERADAEFNALSAKKALRQAELLDALLLSKRSDSGSFPVAGIAVPSESQAAAKALAAKGLVTYVETLQRRNPYRAAGATNRKPEELSNPQATAISALQSAIELRTPKSFLLHGVTGSGKTEVYLHAVEHAIARDLGSLVVLPEIALTAQVLALFKSRLGDDNVAVLHSSLSLGERHDEWQRIRAGQAKVVVGPRSAIFAPINNLGLIVMDEEHDGSYKQDSSPRYHARDIAEFRSQQSNAVVVLGSATPSLETRYLAETGQHTLLRLPDRIDDRPLPAVAIVDLRLQFKKPNSRRSYKHVAGGEERPEESPGIFGSELREAIQTRLDRGEQTILFLNRRGFASFLLCRDCGFSYRCPNCDVSLTYHAAGKMLQCHHCDHIEPAGELCPKCGGLKIRPFGLGTEKVEQAVRDLYPDARVLRMDRDTMSRKGAHEQALGIFRRGDADILIGTQIVAKGLDFPQVTLVGVVTADPMLNIPDFRTAERSFQLLTQVAGRAGRGKKIGQVIIQTFTPEHPSVIMASTHNYEQFYESELEVREDVGYPPFVHLANIIFSDEVDRIAHDRIETFSVAIRKILADRRIDAEILGPTTCPIARLRNRYRWHLVIKSVRRQDLVEALAAAVATLPTASRTGMSLDIDPMSML